MPQQLNETLVAKGHILETNREKLPKGVLCRGQWPICNVGKLNQNNRMYEKEVFQRSIFDNAAIQEKMKNRTLFGHAEHPEGKTQSDLQLTSHVIIDTFIDEDVDGNEVVYQTIDVLDTPCGRIVNTLLEAECMCGVSTRAEGDLEECTDESTGQKYSRVVPSSYKYNTTDFTADPSTYNTRPMNVVREIKSELDSGKLTNEERVFATTLLEAIEKSEQNIDEEKKNESKLSESPDDEGRYKSDEDIAAKEEIAKTDDPVDEKKADEGIVPDDKDSDETKIKKLIEQEGTIESLIQQELIKSGAIAECTDKEGNTLKGKIDRVDLKEHTVSIALDGGAFVTVAGPAPVSISPDGLVLIPNITVPDTAVAEPASAPVEPIEDAPEYTAPDIESEPEPEPGPEPELEPETETDEGGFVPEQPEDDEEEDELPESKKETVVEENKEVNEREMSSERASQSLVYMVREAESDDALQEELQVIFEQPWSEISKRLEDENFDQTDWWKGAVDNYVRLVARGDLEERKVNEQEDEPQEGDIVKSPSGPLGSKTSVSEVEGKFIGEFSSDEEADEAIHEWMKKNKCYPNVWVESDHGNLHLDTDFVSEAKEKVNEEKEYYDVDDVIRAGYTLEPIKCRHCGNIGDVTFNQEIMDAYCEVCGKWQLEDTDESKKMTEAKMNAYDVLLDGQVIDTVFDESEDAEDVKKFLIDHDRYDPDIEVVKCCELKEVKEAKLSPPERHQKQVAIKTLKMSDAGAKIMGGMTKQEARDFLKKIGYTDTQIAKLEESKSAKSVYIRRINEALKRKVNKKTDESNEDSKTFAQGGSGNIKSLYTKKGLTPPDGKGIHTKKFHEVATSVAQGYKEKGDTEKEAKEKGYATAMKMLGKEGAVKKSHRRDESKQLVFESYDEMVDYLKDAFKKMPIEKQTKLVSVLYEDNNTLNEGKENTLTEMRLLKLKEASARAETEKAIEMLSEIEKNTRALRESSKIEVKVLSDKLKESQTIENKEVESLRKLVECKMKTAKDLQKELDNAKASLKETKKAYEDKINAIQKGFQKRLIKEYVNFKVNGSSIRLPSNSRALLENCKSIKEVDKVFEDVRDALRRGALLPEEGSPTIQVHTVKPIDPEQRKILESIGNVFEAM